MATPGFLRAQSDALEGCVDQLHLIDRSECRAEAVRRFSMRRMVLDYLDVYADAMHRDNSGAGAARAGAA